MFKQIKIKQHEKGFSLPNSANMQIKLILSILTKK